jgi:hypothetical protein
MSAKALRRTAWLGVICLAVGGGAPASQPPAVGIIDAGGSPAAPLHAVSRIAIDVREPVGIRRFQYPVAVELTLPQAVARETRFRLLRAGKPVLTQVRAAEAGESVARWWLDFPVDLLPYESAVYELQYGPDVPPGPSPKQGHRLISSAAELRIANDPQIVWTVRRDLGGLLTSVRAGELEYLRTAPSGLLFRDSNGKPYAVGGGGGRPTKVSVTREGLLAVGLRFEFSEILPELHATVDLTFPVFKTWVEVDCRIDDPHSMVATAEAKLDVNLDPPTRQTPTLVDFGTAGLVYLSLGPSQQSQLRGDLGNWQVLRGMPDRLEPFVAGPRQPDRYAPPEGWAHVMDRRHCLAMAVDHFGSAGEDRLGVAADGHVELCRRFCAAKAPQSAVKRLRFWLHFVPYPPQVTAATSPQAMQNPIATRVRVASP